jgi:acyl-CoA reductase-like NAD-dependent aldehyde dehydrogenase
VQKCFSDLKRITKLSFTGSTETGQYHNAAENIIPVTMELEENSKYFLPSVAVDKFFSKL